MKRLVALFILTLIAVPVSAAEPAFPTIVTQQDLITKYQSAFYGGQKLKILLMPGHEPNFGGTELGVLKERNIAVEIANDLATHLRTNPRFEVVIARDTLAWHPDLDEYFEEEWRDIKEFVEDSKKIMQQLLRKGDIEARTFEVNHNSAASDVAYRLYGINKWGNEEGFDLAIHIHLNDNPGATNHSGFAVYIPDQEYGNAAASKPLGHAIANELNDFNASSTLPIENYAIVEDQSLIALGAYNTSNAAVALIEYAYIYENKIKNDLARSVVLDDFAYQTYRGIANYFGDPVIGDNTLALPHVWSEDPLTIGSAGTQIYALQAALKKLGFYPPVDQMFYDCPVSGYMGECTQRAVKAFQASKGLTQTGGIGPKTKAALSAVGF